MKAHYRRESLGSRFFSLHVASPQILAPKLLNPRRVIPYTLPIMRLRGARIALLLATALPLMAENANVVTEEKDDSPTILPGEQDENDTVHQTPSDAIHQESSQLPSVEAAEVLSSDLEVDNESPGEGDIDKGGNTTPSAKELSTGPQDEELPNAGLPTTETDDKESVSDTKISPTAPLDEETTVEDEGRAVEAEETATASEDSSIKDSGESATVAEIDAGSADETIATGSNESESTDEIAEERKDQSQEKEEQIQPQQPSESSTEEAEDGDNLRVSVDYASKSAGALIIEKSSSFKGTSNLLNGDKDKYAIAPCEEKQFVVVSLSEDILVKIIKLANYERFSSTVDEFQILGSQTLGKWVDLGTYSAKAGNGEQVFELREPAWARYLKFKFLSHHGVEYYCTYSQIKVHGSTMVQGFHEQWEDSEEQQDEIMSDTDRTEADSVDGEQETDNSIAETADSESVGGEQNESLSEASMSPEIVDGEINTAESGETNPDVDAIADTIIIDTIGSSIGKFQTSTAIDETIAEVDRGADTAIDETIGSSPSVGKVYTSTELDEMLRGETIKDEDLPSELLDLIPITLNTLSQTSRDSPGRRKTDSNVRTPHQLGDLAMESIYSSTRSATYATGTKALVTENSGTIVAPKMTKKAEKEMEDQIEEIVMEYMGRKQTNISSAPSKTGSDICESCDQPPEMMTSNTTDDQKIDLQDSKTENFADTKTDESITKDMTPDEEEATVVSISQELDSASNSTAAAGKRDHQDDPTSTESMHVLDITLARMAERLPSSECLTKLDFAEFKAKLMASRKPERGTGASTSGTPMEPIFKKLTDEIKALQTSLAVQEQFTKTSVSCYQQVLLDLVIDMEKMRGDQEDRLARLETEFQKSQSSILSVFRQWLLQLGRWFLEVFKGRWLVRLWRKLSTACYWIMYAASAVCIRSYNVVATPLVYAKYLQGLSLGPVVPAILCLCLCRLIVIFNKGVAREATKEEMVKATNFTKPDLKQEEVPLLTDAESHNTTLVSEEAPSLTEVTLLRHAESHTMPASEDVSSLTDAKTHATPDNDEIPSLADEDMHTPSIISP